ncbi:MAG: hypothetical protein IPO27_16965 [Bacteroidetes bacterium]|nr:hypothetical protein [Bacteroidota bacterium]
MKKFILIIICMLCMQGAYSQGRNANWVFGDSAGMHFDGLNTPTVFKTNCKSYGNTATISDSAGNLLFYTYGISTKPQPSSALYDNNYSLMQNGDSLVGDETFFTDIIIPVPASNDKYYHFVCVPSSYIVLYNIVEKMDHLTPGVVLSKII